MYKHNLEKSWEVYWKLGLDENLNFIMFKKFYEKSSKKIEFLSNKITKLIYTTFEVKVLNSALEQNISIDDKSLASLLKRVVSFLKDKEEEEIIFSLEVSQKLIEKIKDFNLLTSEGSFSIRLGEELILHLFSELVLSKDNKIFKNNEELRNFLSKLIKIYSDKKVNISYTYEIYLEKIKKEFKIN